MKKGQIFIAILLLSFGTLIQQTAAFTQKTDGVPIIGGMPLYGATVATTAAPDVDMDSCTEGKSDAAKYHGKKFGHFVLGFLFGPFASSVRLALTLHPKKEWTPNVYRVT